MDNAAVLSVARLSLVKLGNFYLLPVLLVQLNALLVVLYSPENH
jgi:hypothetical protein